MILRLLLFSPLLSDAHVGPTKSTQIHLQAGIPLSSSNDKYQNPPSDNPSSLLEEEGQAATTTVTSEVQKANANGNVLEEIYPNAKSRVEAEMYFEQRRRQVRTLRKQVQMSESLRGYGLMIGCVGTCLMLFGVYLLVVIIRY